MCEHVLPKCLNKEKLITFFVGKQGRERELERDVHREKAVEDETDTRGRPNKAEATVRGRQMKPKKKLH